MASKTRVVTDTFGRKSFQPYDIPISGKIHGTYNLIVPEYAGAKPEDISQLEYNLEKHIPRDLLERYKDIKPHGTFAYLGTKEGKEPEYSYFTNNWAGNPDWIYPDTAENVGNELLRTRIIPELFGTLKDKKLIPHKISILSNMPSIVDQKELNKRIRHKRGVGDYFDFHHRDVLGHLINEINSRLPGGPLSISFDKFEDEGAPFSSRYVTNPGAVLNALRILHQYMVKQHSTKYPTKQ